MARGKLRIRQRGSRQQWAQARTYKEFGSSDGAVVDGATAEAGGPGKPLAGDEVVATSRCGLCNLVVEQRRRDGVRLILIPYSLCISCDGVRCQQCWAAEDDACADGDEHEFPEVHYAVAGGTTTADFASF
jgi:hypothetical protein